VCKTVFDFRHLGIAAEGSLSFTCPTGWNSLILRRPTRNTQMASPGPKLRLRDRLEHAIYWCEPVVTLFEWSRTRWAKQGLFQPVPMVDFRPPTGKGFVKGKTQASAQSESVPFRPSYSCTSPKRTAYIRKTVVEWFKQMRQ
jgi:hypothetical protein